MRLSKHAAAVWSVLRRRRWHTGEEITYVANVGIIESDCDAKTMTTATCTARIRDFRKARYGGHTIVCKRMAGYDAPVYKLIK